MEGRPVAYIADEVGLATRGFYGCFGDNWNTLLFCEFVTQPSPQPF